MSDDVAELTALPGIGPLTGALGAFAAFFQIDRDLVQAAAESSAGGADDGAMSADAAREVLAALPEREKTELLLRLVEGDPHLAAELKRRVRENGTAPHAASRTVGELRQRAAALRLARERAAAERLEAERRRQAEKAENARRARLTALMRRGESVWREVEDEIEHRNAPAYDRAAGLLFDLEAIAGEQGALADFTRRVEAIRERHARKGKLIERLKTLKAT